LHRPAPLWKDCHPNQKQKYCERSVSPIAIKTFPCRRPFQFCYDWVCDVPGEG
jgi:hypothetical protein